MKYKKIKQNSDQDEETKKVENEEEKEGEEIIEEEINTFNNPERTRLLKGDDEYCKEYSNLLSENEKSSSFPSSVFFIIGNEFCERFSYYGLRTVLAIYLSSELLMSEDSATSLFHGWTFLCYFTTILGAFLADSVLGRYRTIFYLSVTYLVGNSVLSLASTEPIVPSLVGKKAFSLIGLLLIAFGTGGIKPCVSAFGGDQFTIPRQEKQLTKFFLFFYFSINAGALLSTFVTPVLREDVSCFGGDCFPLAFGVPAILMLVALALFLIGTPRYKIVPPEGNVAAQVLKCILYASYGKITSKSDESKDEYYPKYKCGADSSHWLDYARDRFSASLISDVKAVLRVLVLFLPLPIFWALFDQQGSRWTFQAAKMSGDLGNITIKPDQMQVLNPFLIMFLIPCFDYFVYPFLNRFEVLTKPLHRMFFGGLLAALAFVAAGIVQLNIESTQSSELLNEKFSLIAVNALPCEATIGLTAISQSDKLLPFESIMMNFETNNFRKLENETNFTASVTNTEAGTGTGTGSVTDSGTATVTVNVSNSNAKCRTMLNEWSSLVELQLNSKKQTIVVTSYIGKLLIIPLPEDRKDQKESTKSDSAEIRIVDSSGFLRIADVEMKKGNLTKKMKSNFFSKGISATNSKMISPGRFEILLPNINGGDGSSLGFIYTEKYSSNIVFLHNELETGKIVKQFKTFYLKSNGVHMLWLLPQYILISVGEIMFSITGLEFSFKQAPMSMKSVVQAAWFLNNAFGNLLVVAVAESKLFKNQSLEFFLFSGLMVLDMMVFFLLAKNFHLSTPGYDGEHSGTLKNCQGSTLSLTSSCDSDLDISENKIDPENTTF